MSTSSSCAASCFSNCSCADVRTKMREDVRFNSQSTGNTTLMGPDESHIVSPLYPPSPFMQTAPDNKQWVDLDYVSPKLLRELRRHYDPSLKDEPTHPFAKGAAKIKAWARQSKLGIDIRLRRKLNEQHDEVTDIKFIQEPYVLQHEDLHVVAELPGTSHQISELSDTSVPHELASVSEQRSRSPTGYSTIDALPRYEPPTKGTTSSGDPNADGDDRVEPDRPLRHQRSLSGFSIVATPRRGLSVHDASTTIADSPQLADQLDSKPLETALSKRERDSRVGRLQSDLRVANQKLDEERVARERFESLLKDVQEELSNQRQTSNGARNISHSGQNIFRGLKVAESSRYETETDLEPPSPSVSSNKPAIRGKKVLGYPYRKRSGKKTKASAPSASNGASTSTGQAIGLSGLLERQPTKPPKLKANATIEDVWSSLLAAQAKLIGPEHPFTYQAKSDLARSRAKQHAQGDKSILLALSESRQLATQLLGEAHPWVLAFSENFQRLEDMTLGSEAVNAENAVNADVTQNLPDKEDVVPPSHVLQGSDGEPPPAATDMTNPAAVVDPTVPPGRTLPALATKFVAAEKEPSPVAENMVVRAPADPWALRRPPHSPRNQFLVLWSLVLSAATEVALRTILWLQRNYGPEQRPEPGKVRVRWTCACGQQMHDDFVERRPGAARELEAYLNRPRTHTSGSPTSPSSSHGSRPFTNSSSFGSVPSSQTSWSSGFPGNGSSGNTKSPITTNGLPFHPLQVPREPPWLLTCANEERYTPKLAHLDMDPWRIRSDKDLAISLRNHYFNVNKKWWRSLRLRGLTTIEFVQFEVHSNRFADIRKCPDMPAVTSEYSFEPGDLLPPVGSHYLLHLFKHPEDYDNELITYLRAPKKAGRLQGGVGWGINLVEGFEASKVWMMTSTFFAFGSLVFAVAWAWKRHDVQAAFGVAAWICSLAGLVVGWLQATLG